MPSHPDLERRLPIAAFLAAALTTALLCARIAADQTAQTATTPPTADPPVATSGNALFQLTGTHQVHLAIAASEWAVLQTSSARGGGAGGTDYRQPDGRLVHVGSGFAGIFPWVHADVRADGTEFKDVGLRYKGNFSFAASSAAAPLFANFKVKIDVNGTRGSWDGVKVFNLHPGVVDTSRMREAIAFAVFRAAGVPAPRTSNAELFFTVPGLYQDTPAGLFTLIEDVNKRFLERALPPGTGLLMKPEGLRGGIQSLGENWDAYKRALRPDRDATPHEQQRVLEFAHLISQTDVALFRARIGTYLDVDEFLRFIAVNALLANWDSYLSGSHNFYLYLDPRDDKFRFLPWDLDLSMGARSMGASVDVMHPYRNEEPLIYWLLDDPEVAAKYRRVVQEIATTIFNRQALNDLVTRLDRIPPSRGSLVRPFIDSQTAYVDELLKTKGGLAP